MKTQAILFILLLTGSAAAWPITDPAGDLSNTAGDSPATSSGADLLGLSVTEDLDSLTFTLETEAWRAAGVPGLDGVTIWIPFFYGEAGYAFRVDLYDSIGATSRFVTVNMRADVSGDNYGRQYTFFEPVVENGKVTWTVDKSVIRDENSVPLVAGRSLTGFHAESMQGNVMTADDTRLFIAADRMPNADALDFLSEVGPVQSEILQLFSSQPLRWSNGGASTYAFDLQMVNKENATIEFAAENVPSGWTVHLPEPTQQEKGTVTVYLQTTDRHLHDGSETFTVVAKGTEDARTEIGIHYPKIPMPAGHHPTIYFHGTEDPPTQIDEVFDLISGATGTDESRLYMNTMPEDDVANLDAVPGDMYTDEGFIWAWPVMLEPFLRTGLNFTGTGGEISFGTTATTPEVPGTFSGELLFFAPEGGYSWYPDRPFEAHILATFATPGTPGDTITGTWENWEVPDTSYRPGVQLAMNLYFRPETEAAGGSLHPVAQGPWTPSIAGGSMQLPLGEYHDDVTIPLTAAQAEEVEALEENNESEAEETPFIPILFVLVALAIFEKTTKRLK